MGTINWRINIEWALTMNYDEVNCRKHRGSVPTSNYQRQDFLIYWFLILYDPPSSYRKLRPLLATYCMKHVNACITCGIVWRSEAGRGFEFWDLPGTKWATFVLHIRRGDLRGRKNPQTFPTKIHTPRKCQKSCLLRMIKNSSVVLSLKTNVYYRLTWP